MHVTCALLGAGLLAGSGTPRTSLADWYVDANVTNCAAGSGSAAAPFCTIAEAITAAVHGDTICIAPGTHAENLTVGEDLRFVGTDARDGTLVDGGGTARVFDVLAGATVTIEGTTVASNSYIGVHAIDTGDAPVQIRDSTISGNGWAGLLTTTSSTVQVEGVTIVNNGTGPCWIGGQWLHNGTLVAEVRGTVVAGVTPPGS